MDFKAVQIIQIYGGQSSELPAMAMKYTIQSVQMIEHFRN